MRIESTIRMFGLMRGRGEQRRLHYCGTCKTIGQTYGHAARLLLNHDAVFLAELLTHLAGASGRDWEPAYQQRACWAKPHERELPAVLRYAGAITIFLADAKLADHADDSRRHAARWRWLQKLLSPRTTRAESELQNWSVPVVELRALLASQTRRERQRDAGWQAWAYPTATATSVLFRQGADVIGRPELAAPLDLAGRQFGRLVYLLDAWEDYDRDRADGSFNALAVQFGERRRAVVETAAADAAWALRALGCEGFALRLQQNAASRLGLALPVICECETPRAAWIAGAGHSGIVLMSSKASKAKKRALEEQGLLTREGGGDASGGTAPTGKGGGGGSGAGSCCRSSDGGCCCGACSEFDDCGSCGECCDCGSCCGDCCSSGCDCS